MKIVGPIRRAIRREVGRLIEQDKDVRALIARCARSVAKDYIEDQAEAKAEADQTERTTP